MCRRKPLIRFCCTPSTTAPAVTTVKIPVSLSSNALGVKWSWLKATQRSGKEQEGERKSTARLGLVLVTLKVQADRRNLDLLSNQKAYNFERNEARTIRKKCKRCKYKYFRWQNKFLRKVIWYFLLVKCSSRTFVGPTCESHQKEEL